MLYLLWLALIAKRVSKSAKIEHENATLLQSGSQSMKQVILAFLHHLLLSLENSEKVNGRESLNLSNCVPSHGGIFIERINN